MGESTLSKALEIFLIVRENPHRSYCYNMAVEKLPSEGWIPHSLPPPDVSSKGLGSSPFRQNDNYLIISDK